MEIKLTVNQLEIGKVYKREGYATKYMLSETGNLLDNDPYDGFYKLSSIKYNDALKPIFTEIKKEIDWDKVPRMTKVQVRDNENNNWINKYWCEYVSYKEYKFKVSSVKDDDYIGTREQGCLYKYCRIHSSVSIPEEWYK